MAYRVHFVWHKAPESDNKRHFITNRSVSDFYGGFRIDGDLQPWQESGDAVYYIPASQLILIERI